MNVLCETIPCPLCRSESSRPFRTGWDRLYGIDGEFQLVCCTACRHIYVNPRPTAESLAKFYPDQYAPFRQTNAQSLQSADWKSWLRRLGPLRRAVHSLLDSHAVYVPPVPTGERRALELGCADGRFLAHLAQEGWDVTGIEPSAQAAASARSRGLTVHTGRLEDAGLPNERFAAVFAWMVLEHVPEPLQTLTEIRRLLRADGWLVFSVPNHACWEPRVFGRYWHAYDLPRHLHHFTPKTLRRLLDATGFRLERIVHQRSWLNVAGSVGLLADDLWPRSSLGRRLLKFVDNPTAAGLLLLLPGAMLSAWLRQAGRLTVVARPVEMLSTR